MRPVILILKILVVILKLEIAMTGRTYFVNLVLLCTLYVKSPEYENTFAN